MNESLQWRLSEGNPHRGFPWKPEPATPRRGQPRQLHNLAGTKKCRPIRRHPNKRPAYFLALFSHCWFAIPQLVLQADWQEVWHSPQPPFLALSHRLRVFSVLISSIAYPSRNARSPGVDFLYCTIGEKVCQLWRRPIRPNWQVTQPNFYWLPIEALLLTPLLGYSPFHKEYCQQEKNGV